jgi:hypothetical protein
MARPLLRSAWWAVSVSAALLLLPSLLAAPGGAPAHAGAAAPDPSLLPRTLPIHFHTTLYPLLGTLVGEGTPPEPIASERVTLADQLCAGPVGPSTCTTVNSTLTNATGAFSFVVPNGSYYAYATNGSQWGGAWAPVTVTGVGATVALRAYPWVPYGNATFVLPAWNNLSGRAANCNAQIPCAKAPYGTQVPVLSWTQDGAVYVNATDELVFYSFVNRSVTALGAWVPLYDNVMGYDGVENTEWLTQDGSYAYEFGCLSSCTNSSTVTLYALNLSTGRSFEHNFTGLTDGALYSNAQVNLVGLDGNDSVAALFLANGTVDGYGLWNRTQWVLGDLPFFEANNVYWLPAYNAFVDVEAEGSSSDRIDEYALTGAGAGGALEQTYTGKYASGYDSNGVDGLFVNVSSHELLVSESRRLGDLRSQLFSFGGTGTLTGLTTSYPTGGLGAWPENGAYPNSYSSEHRVSLVSSGPMFMGFWDGLFDNGSWLYDPATGGYLSTNVSFDDNQSASATFHEEHQNPNQVEGLFFNTSYSILGASVDCQSAHDHCAIRGTVAGTQAGTVWWTWKLGLPEFPYPASAALAQPLPPSILALSATANGSSVSLAWTAPAEGSHPILNYTVFWGTSPGALDSVLNLPGSASGATLSGLLPGEVIYYGAYAWNLHWHGPLATGVVSTTDRAHLIASFSASHLADDVGLPVYLRVNLTGPVAGANYSYYNLPPGCPSENGPVLLCVPAGAGLYAITAMVADSNGTADFANLSLTVNPALALESWSAPSPIGANTSTSFSISIGVTGTAPYSVAWSFGDGARGTGFSVLHAYASPGPYFLQASVTDAVGARVNFSGLVEVLPPIHLVTTVTPSPAEVGLPVLLTANVTAGGVAPFSYRWSLPGANQSSILRTNFTSPGVYPVLLTVTDATGLRASASLNVSVAPSPSILSEGATPPATDVGRPLTLSINVSGGVAPYRYQYLDLPPGCASADLASLLCAPSVAGSYPVRTLVTDSLAASAIGSFVFEVNPPLSIPLFLAEPEPALTQETVAFSLEVAGGTAPFTASYANSSGGCRPTPTDPLNASCTFVEPGEYDISVRVADAAGGSAGAELTLEVSAAGASSAGGRSTDSPGVPAWFYPAVLALLAAILVAVVWVHRSQPRRPAEPASSAPPGLAPGPGRDGTADGP